MGKRSQIERAIDAINAEIAVLEHARARLIAAQGDKPKPARKVRPAKAKADFLPPLDREAV